MCLAATRFEEAGNYLFRGNLDPRLLLRHFPDLQPSPLLVPPDATVDVYAGISEQLKALGSVEDISEYLRPPFPRALANIRLMILLSSLLLPSSLSRVSSVPAALHSSTPR